MSEVDRHSYTKPPYEEQDQKKGTVGECTILHFFPPALSALGSLLERARRSGQTTERVGVFWGEAVGVS